MTGAPRALETPWMLGAEAMVPLTLRARDVLSRLPAELGRFTPSTRSRPTFLAPPSEPGALGQLYRRFALARRSTVIEDFGRDPELVHRAAPILDHLARRWFRLAVDGKQFLPETGPAVLVANHSGVLPYDVLMLMHVVSTMVGRPLRPLVEDEVMHAPFIGPMLTRLGAVRASRENATRLLESGSIIAVFPEGAKGTSKSRRDRYRLQRFGRGGFVRIAMASAAPMIPTAVVGAEESSPLLLQLGSLKISPLIPLPTPWRVSFGKPIKYHFKDDRRHAAARGQISATADDVRLRIEQLLRTSRARTRSR